jgi:hypothetical protein
MTRMEKERREYRRCGDFFFVWWVEHKFAHIPLASPFGMGWVGRCGLQDEQAAITYQLRRWVVTGIRIEEARRSEVFLLEIDPRDVSVIDSILALEDIELPIVAEHCDSLLSKLKREVVMEEGSFT